MVGSIGVALMIVEWRKNIVHELHIIKLANKCKDKSKRSELRRRT